MALALRIVIVLFCVVFFGIVCKQVASGKLLLRYSLLWMIFAIVTVICAIFPSLVYWISDLLGFLTPSNLVFFIAIFMLMAICLSLSVVVSKQAVKIKALTQHLAQIEANEKEDAS